MKNLNIAIILIIIYLSSWIGCNGILPPKLPTSFESEDLSPSWSHDGNWIAYHHFNYDINDTTYPTGLYIIDTLRQNKKLIYEGLALAPDWSPDGEKIVFANDDIFTITTTSDSLDRVTNFGKAYFPSWSPDGNKIAFDTPYQDPKGSNVIWLINADGTNLKDISEHGIGEMRDPDWSPNGCKIIYSGSHGSTSSESQLWLIDATGTNRVQLTSNNFITNRDPSWSPDGSNIVWTATGSKGKSKGGIMLMNYNGNNQHFLIEGEMPAWAPDSKRIVFSRALEDRVVLNIINIDGKNLRQLTH